MKTREGHEYAIKGIEKQSGALRLILYLGDRNFRDGTQATRTEIIEDLRLSPGIAYRAIELLEGLDIVETSVEKGKEDDSYMRIMHRLNPDLGWWVYEFVHALEQILVLNPVLCPDLEFVNEDLYMVVLEKATALKKIEEEAKKEYDYIPFDKI